MPKNLALFSALFISLINKCIPFSECLDEMKPNVTQNVITAVPIQTEVSHKMRKKNVMKINFLKRLAVTNCKAF